MRSNTTWTSSVGPLRPTKKRVARSAVGHRGPTLLIGVALLGAFMAPGCAVCPNQYVDDGPSTDMPANSPAGEELYARYQPAPQRVREQDPSFHAARSGAVKHLPFWFENPFVEQGSGRSDHRLGCEDWLAMVYGLGRAMVNLGGSPASVVFTPPWLIMESDGRAARRWPDLDEFDARAVHRWPGFDAFAASSSGTESSEPRP
ncbi:hypothetical protein RAS1_13180 [Phycisphaerae bacterium RAS1]|nr:hypothetical protein RAS1_13180 [Phycisphaerae bacterium RAS1]